ncbi:MAG: glycosyltransferase family 2 protein [bacterium]|nr:glycosyltransferase family 2 protein [bacterium]
MDAMIYLSVVIPAYNEANRIEKSIRRILEYLEQQDYTSELIIVDDGSSDDTPSITQAFCKKSNRVKVIRYIPNRGKGYAVRTGMLGAKGKYRLFSDADLSTPIEELAHFLRIMEQQDYQIIIGSRGLTNSQILKHQPWFREKMGKIFNHFVQWLVFPGIKDTQCGFKLFRAEVIEPLFSKQTIDRFSFDVELLYLAQKVGFKIKEEPVRWVNSPATKVNPITDATQMFFDLLRIRWRHRNSRLNR